MISLRAIRYNYLRLYNLPKYCRISLFELDIQADYNRNE